MQNPRLQTQKSTAPTELTPRTRADAGSSLSGLVRSTPKYWIGSAALISGIGAVVSSITTVLTARASVARMFTMASDPAR